MELVLTPTIQQSLVDALKDDAWTTKQGKEARQLASLDLDSAQPVGISWPLLQDLATHLKAHPAGTHFHEILQGAQVYHPPKPEKEKDPEFEAYMEKLRMQEKERQYNAMIASAVPLHDQNDGRFNSQDLREVRAHLATIANIGFSMVAIYVAVYMASKALFNDIGLRVLLGMGGAIGIGVVEVILYVNYNVAITKSKEKRNKKKGKKLA
ncbi:hypothetical protein DM01DRAFT_1409799 [Hesseltinella vesiculosa]|uniref:Endoplasmic reticulum-based factor for assembly of V-ATPase n=1 Tax=Hesseltinella vesiculosa TaxID=101127 RepID=A0A1X2G9J7_9FUNG|nr:hypothetical protein DM01DRAFT_1409799 [Hesseltinella vesiculosa]